MKRRQSISTPSALRFSKISLSIALLCIGFNFAPDVSAQQTERNRVIIQPMPTPQKSPTPPVAAPSPAVSPVPTPASVSAGQTVPELQSKIRQILLRPELRRGQVGVKIVSLDTGKTLFEENAEKYFMPASNMKSYTVAAALARLTPDFRFVTSVYAPGAPDSSGTIRGDVIVYGRGDPTFATAFTRAETSAPATDADYLKGLEALAEKIAAAGVRRIEGNLVGDESYFNTEPIPASWEWDDLQWYYGAEVSALTVGDNALDLRILPTVAGSPVTVQTLPANSVMQIINRATTAPAGTKRDIRVTKRLAQNVLEISGTMPADDKGYSGFVAVSRPAQLFAALLRRLLEQKGIVVTGQTRAVNFAERGNIPLNTSVLTEVARLESAPLSVVAAKTMKPSQNLYTELILRALGEAAGDKTDPRRTSEARGIEAVQKFLTEAGIAPGSVVQQDASGLSRHNLVTPASNVALYSFMSRHTYAQVWRDSLTIGGVDGTLRNRFAGTRAANNARGKTGTIAQVSALSGYVTTASGERLAFSVLTNFLPETRPRTQTIDEIVLLLANFNGRTD